MRCRKINTRACMKKITRVILLNVNVTNSRENQNIFCSCVRQTTVMLKKTDRGRREISRGNTKKREESLTDVFKEVIVREGEILLSSAPLVYTR